ncbi:MerR family transcriptional regulator [Marinibaculum pumilum]|uniref:MerR family transcriptional regulator n=1 Tax=Marinibaculum pumilum TaxID=1766165 RepID=A0ABV7LAP7_9PROT
MHAIGVAAARSGLTIETIRYYERAGVTASPHRTAAGRRLYSEHQIAALRFIKRCRDLGFSIADAKALLELSDDPQRECGPAGELARRHLSVTRQKLAELSKLEAALQQVVTACEADAAQCPLLLKLLEPD